MKVHLATKFAMIVHRRILTKDRIVYLLVGKKSFKYKTGRSRIAYIGTSKRGAKRIASSAAANAEEMFSKHGSKEMHVFIASSTGRSGLATWELLERAFLAEFLNNYKELPFCNKQGKKYKFTDELDKLFRQKRIRELLMTFDASEH